MKAFENEHFFSIIGLMCSCIMKTAGASLYRIK
jgi:hypothetical protein